MQYFLIFFMAVSWVPNQANEDKSQLRGETHKEMTETNSHYYRNADTFLPLGSISAVSRVRSLILPECGLIFPNSGW